MPVINKPKTLLAALSIALLLSIFSNVSAQTWTARPNTNVTGNIGGFYEYLPTGYSSGTDRYPLIIAIHGVGALGNGGSELDRIKYEGLSAVITNGQFPQSFTVNGQTHRMLVIAPQFVNWPTAYDINTLINYTLQRYRVNPSRIYLTGLSMGGGGVWEYVGNNINYGKRIAAIVPVCGASWPDYTRSRVINSSNVAIWATHNDGDPTVPLFYSTDYVANINAAPAPTPPAKLTVFQSGSHDAWTRTYDLNNFRENGLNVIEWMLQYERNYGGVNQTPFADAGSDVSVTLPNNSVQLDAFNSWDIDGYLTGYSWAKISGPTQFNISNANISNPVISNMAVGTYVFRLTVTDNGGATQTDDITITQNGVQSVPGKIEAESYTSMNGIAIEPTADAGGGYNVGYIDAGDWMEYLPTVASTGSYNVNFRVACPNGGGQLQLLSGGNLLTTISIPATGSFQNWVTIPATINLNSGAQTLRVYAATGSWNINWMEFTLNTPVNQPPTADAGPNQLVITPASTATLNGSGNDPDGSIASYAWTFESGPVTPIISSPNASVAGISGLSQTGTYVFKLTVTDNGGASANSTTAVIVSNSSSGSSFYRPITINKNRVVNTAQTNFPVLFSGTFDYLKTVAFGGKVYSSSGHDIQFTTDVAGVNKLSWEIEKYVPSTGEIVAWIKTDVSPVTDKVIYMHYGNSSIGAFQGSVIGTWNSSYAGVYHLSNNSGSLSARDATINANNGTVNGATATAAQIDGGANLSGASQYINAGNSSSLGITGSVTLQAWVNPADYANYNGIIGKTAAQLPKPYDFYLGQGNGRPTIVRGNGNAGVYSSVAASSAPPTNTWSYVVVTISGTNVTHYLNGNLNGTGTLSSAVATGTDNLLIGSRNDFATMFKGKLDEVRIVNGALTSDWIKTEYNNQSSPSTFWTIGTEVNNGGGANQPPVVSAGNAQTITQPTSSATIAGTASDADGSITSTTWRFVSGPSTATIQSPGSLSTVVSGLTTVGNYIFSLTAKDNTGDSTTASVTVTVAAASTNQPPVVSAGNAQTITQPANSARLSGTASDPDGTIASTTWKFVSGPSSVFIDAPASLTPNVYGLTATGNYIFSLTARDNNNDSTTASVTIRVQSGAANQPPVVSAGNAQTITQPASSATITGTASDADGTIASTTWKFVSGPSTATIQSPSALSTVVSGLTAAGNYIFSLTARDNNNDSTTASVTVTVQSAGGGGSGDFYRPLTINRNQVVGTGHNNFAVLISGTYDFLRSTSNGGKVANINGYDIRFTADIPGATNLNWEIEKYVPATGELIAWVKTDITSAADKVIYLHYGNASITSYQGNATGTWNSNYGAVQHLPNETVLSANDATANGNNGAITGATAASGRINGGAQFSGGNQYVNIGSGSSLGVTGNMTLQAWVNPSDFSNYSGIIGKTSGAYPKPYDFYLDQGTGIPKLYRGSGTVYGYSFVGGSSAPATNTWSLITVTVSGNTVTHYINGNVNGSGTLSGSGAAANGTDNVYIGTRSDLATHFKGRLDEVRVLSAALSQEWIRTEYNNQSSPSTFYSIGTEAGSGNQLPVVNAGTNQTITLPTNTVSLSGSATDADGTISNYAWTQVSGPTVPAAVINSPNTANTTVSNLQQGTYVFRLTATDNNSGIGYGEVTIIVNGVGGGSGGPYYRMITINRSQVSNAIQSQFPVLISGTYPYLRSTANGGQVANSNGYDIRFTNDVQANDKLNWEIERYNPVTGQIVAWVKVDVSPSADKVIYMHYGSTSITSFQGNVNGTWNSNFAAVHHLANGTTLTPNDATVNGNNGANNGATASASGAVDGCAAFAGSGQYINIGNGTSLGITGNITLQAWVNPTDYNNYNGIAGKTTGGLPRPYDFYLDQGSGLPKLYRGNGTYTGYSFVQAQTAPPLNTWSHIAVVVSGNTVTHYLNGNVNGTGTLTTTGANGSENMYIGSRSDVATRFKGRLDEVRVVNAALSSDWIKTDYNSQALPGTFYTISGELATGREMIVSRSGVPNTGETTIGEEVKENVSLYPNPVTSEFVLSVSAKESGTMQISIIDQQGRIQKTVRAPKNSIQTQVRINAASLAKGVYLVKIDMPNYHETVKMIKR